MQSISVETTNSEEELACSICKCTDGNFVNITECNELKKVKEQIIQHSSIKIITQVCQKCLYKLYTVVERSRIEEYKKVRSKRQPSIKSKTNHKIPQLSPSSESSSSSNISIVPDDQIFVREFVGGANIQTASEYQNSSGQDECEEEEENAIKTNGGNIKEKEKNCKYNYDNSAYLDIMFECPESALVTESGGNIDQYKPQPQRCLYCPKTFVRQKMFKKHVRSHENKLRSRSRSASKSRGRSILTNLVYKCDDCPTTFGSSQLLKKHSKIHLVQYNCNFCHLYFFTTSERDVHQAECFGIEMAKTSATRRSTRSVTRSLAARSQYAKSINTDNSSLKENTYRSGSARTRISKTKTRTTCYEDDEVSVSCSDHFSLVQSWVNKTCKMLNSKVASDEPIVLSQKEYDIVMLEKLIEQSERGQYTCTFMGCDYIALSLRDMCFHEVKMHKSKTYYNCRKCKGRFTSKLFLDYHLYMQNYGEYHCNKCTMTFIYEYKLQHHLLQHQQHESFVCLFCDSSYMSETELRLHVVETGHNANKRKRTISIDPTMTITNKTETDPPPPKRVYRCEIKILVLPRTETKRPLQIIWPKYTKIFLGDLDFEYEPGRNCVRTS